MNLLWLGDPKSFDAGLVGGKAANLSRLARMYHRVPDGFSLPVTVMDEAHPLDMRDEITAAISDLMNCHSLPDFIAAVRSSDLRDIRCDQLLHEYSDLRTFH